MTKAREDGPSAAARIRVMKRDRFTCTYCGAPGTDAELEVDHIVAVANGGSHHISNLTTACRPCNQDKGTKNLKPNGNGHGKGAERHPLVGMYFMMFEPKEGWLEPGIYQFQGQVLGVDGDVVLCQMFSALDGGCTDVRPFEKSFMYTKLCRLFAEHDAFISAADTRVRREQACYRKLLDAERLAVGKNAGT